MFLVLAREGGSLPFKARGFSPVSLFYSFYVPYTTAAKIASAASISL